MPSITYSIKYSMVALVSEAVFGNVHLSSNDMISTKIAAKRRINFPQKAKSFYQTNLYFAKWHIIGGFYHRHIPKPGWLKWTSSSTNQARHASSFISGGLCNRRNKLTYCLVKDRHIESSGIERIPIGFECFSLTFPGERTVMKVISAFLSWRNRVRYLDD